MCHGTRYLSVPRPFGLANFIYFLSPFCIRIARRLVVSAFCGFPNESPCSRTDCLLSFWPTTEREEEAARQGDRVLDRSGPRVLQHRQLQLSDGHHRRIEHVARVQTEEDGKPLTSLHFL